MLELVKKVFRKNDPRLPAFKTAFSFGINFLWSHPLELNQIQIMCLFWLKLNFRQKILACKGQEGQKRPCNFFGHNLAEINFIAKSFLLVPLNFTKNSITWNHEIPSPNHVITWNSRDCCQPYELGILQGVGSRFHQRIGSCIPQAFLCLKKNSRISKEKELKVLEITQALWGNSNSSYLSPYFGDILQTWGIFLHLTSCWNRRE